MINGILSCRFAGLEMLRAKNEKCHSMEKLAWRGWECQ